MENSIGISLVSLDNEVLTVKMLEHFNEIAFNWFKTHNVSPTYWSISDKKMNSKLVKFTQRKLSNLRDKKRYLDKDGDLIIGLSYVVNPEGSDAPAYDDFFDLNIGFLDYSTPTFETKDKKLYITLSVNPNKISIKPNEINWFINQFATLFQVDYGMVYLNSDYEHVSAEAIGYDDGNYHGRKKEIMNWWYALSHKEKLQNLRDIYPVNILRTEIYKDIIEKLLNGDREFFKFYTHEENQKLFHRHAYRGNMIQVEIDDPSLTCIVERNIGLDFC